jgi:hypothetical protein
MNYTFKRDFYYETVSKLNDTNIIFILGPRKCGKTVCLKQIASNFPDAEYVDMKKAGEDQGAYFIDKIITAILQNEKKLFLVDEVTYLRLPELEIERIADACSEGEHSNTKIIFAGSQSVALDCWGHRSFAGNAEFIRPDFLSYSEWLSYKGLQTPAAENYMEFICTVKDFYGFSSVKEYLQGCIDETVLSNYKTSNIIFSNECDLIDSETLLNVLYTTMFPLYALVSNNIFSNGNKIQLENDIQHYFRETYREAGNEDLGERIGEYYALKYHFAERISEETLKQAFLFLLQNDLITITPVTDDTNRIPEVQQQLKMRFSNMKIKESMFKDFHACIKYPMFYVQMLQDLLQDKWCGKVPDELLGAVVECHLRGILPNAGAFEYYNPKSQIKLDYIGILQGRGIAFSVSKKPEDAHFEMLEYNDQKILITKDTQKEADGIKYIPYYQFIYEQTAYRIKQSVREGIDLFIANRL